MRCTQTLHTQASRHLTFTSPIFTPRGTVSQSQTEESNISDSSHLSSLFHQFALNLNPPGGKNISHSKGTMVPNEACHILYIYLIIYIITWPYVLRLVFICQSSRSNSVVTYSLSAHIVSEHVLFGCIRKGSFSLLHHSSSSSIINNLLMPSQILVCVCVCCNYLLFTGPCPTKAVGDVASFSSCILVCF